MIARRAFLAGLSGLALPALLPAAARAESDVLDEADFAVMLGSTRIGRHALRVRRDGDAVVAEQEGEATVRVGPVPITRIRQSSVEVYRYGLLERLQIANESGYYEPRLRHISAEANGSGIRLVDNQGRDYEIDRAAMPGTGWRKASLQAPVLISPRNGKPREPEVVFHGNGTIETPATGRIEAEHWSLEGDDMDSRLWYEAGSDRLVRMILRFDGRDIEYLRQ